MRLLFAALVLLPSLALAEPASVARVHDGDTVSVWLAGVVVKVRVARLDTPETGTRAKCEAVNRRAKLTPDRRPILTPLQSVVRARADRPGSA